MKFKIGKTLVGENSPSFIVAELSANHGNSLSTALKTIDDAVLCNAFDIYPDDLKKFGYAGPFNQSKYRSNL